MKIVLDTNVLLVSIPRMSKYRPIFDALLSGRIELSVSNEILSECLEIIAVKTTPTIANNIAELLMNLPNVELIATYFRWSLITADADDNKFVDCAIAANSDYLVSNDRHFRELERISFPQVNVLTPIEFLDLIN